MGDVLGLYRTQEFITPAADIANAEVVGAERGWIRLANRSGGLEDTPCVYLDIK